MTRSGGSDGKKAVPVRGWLILLLIVVGGGVAAFFLFDYEEEDTPGLVNFRQRTLEELRAQEAEEIADMSPRELDFVARSVDTIFYELEAILGEERPVVSGLGSAGQTLAVVAMSDWRGLSEATRRSIGTRLQAGWERILDEELERLRPRVHLIDRDGKSLAIVDANGEVVLLTGY